MDPRKMVKNNAALIIILLVSFVLRLWGIKFGFPFFLHPDETKIVEPAITMAFGFRKAFNLGDIYFFDPEFFFYPSFLIYFLMMIIVLLKFVFSVIDSFPFGYFPFTIVSKQALYVIARLTSVFFGTATVAVVYSLGKKIHSRQAGLISALLLGLNFLHVKNSHYFTGDIAATFFITLSFLLLYKYLGSNKERWLYASSIFIGLGIATKYYPVLVLAPLALIVLSDTKTFVTKLRLLFVSSAISVITFVLVVPFSLLNRSLFLDELKLSSLRSSSGVLGYVNSNPFYYLYSQEPSFHEPFTNNSLLQGLGLPLLIFSLFSILFIIWRKKRLLLPIVLFVVLHYLFFAFHITKIVRWMIPLVPFLALLSSWTLLEISRRWRLRRLLVSLGLLILLIPNLINIAKVNLAFSRTDTRVQAQEWIVENIPSGSRVVFEYFSVPDLVNRDFDFYEFEHNRYNINGIVENSRAPDFVWINEVFRPDFIILNGEKEGRYMTSSTKRYFAETSRSWLNLYDSIDREYAVAARFEPSFPDNIRSGPTITIYEPRK